MFVDWRVGRVIRARITMVGRGGAGENSFVTAGGMEERQQRIEGVNGGLRQCVVEDLERR